MGRVGEQQDTRLEIRGLFWRGTATRRGGWLRVDPKACVDEEIAGTIRETKETSTYSYQTKHARLCFARGCASALPWVGRTAANVLKHSPQKKSIQIVKRRGTLRDVGSFK